MALVNCPECNHSVSETAAACPNCGCHQAGRKGKTVSAGSGLVLLGIFVSIPLMILLMDAIENVPLSIILGFTPAIAAFIFTAIRK